MANVAFGFQEAVFTLESMVANIERQAQTIEKLINENKQLRQENQQWKARIAELEARTKKNSTNSHFPPSSDRFGAKSPSRFGACHHPNCLKERGIIRMKKVGAYRMSCLQTVFACHRVQV
ncbi:Mobile element protein [Anoxybacillus flavithermus]|nr:Mobile element protein [Anoxybacillus flavithermus]